MGRTSGPLLLPKNKILFLRREKSDIIENGKNARRAKSAGGLRLTSPREMRSRLPRIPARKRTALLRMGIVRRRKSAGVCVVASPVRRRTL